MRRLCASAVASTLLSLLVGCGSGPPVGPPRARPATPPPALTPAATPVAQRPLPTPTAAPNAQWAATAPPIPILMYHVIANPPANDPANGLYVSPSLLSAQVSALAAAGYEAITLQRAYDIWSGAAARPPLPVVLSFDDGYISVYDHALPTLAARGWPGVLNLQVGRIGVPGGLTATEIAAMVRAGWEIDDHTVTHPDLTRLTGPRLTREISGAAGDIRRQFGVPVHFFCYPAGRYDPAVVAAVRAAGFLGATTTWPGDAYPPTEGLWTLDRVRVVAGESGAALLANLRNNARALPAAPPVRFPPPEAVQGRRSSAVV